MSRPLVHLAALLTFAAGIACDRAPEPAAPLQRARLEPAELEFEPDEDARHEKSPRPQRPQDLRHIADARDRVDAHMSAFRDALAQTPDEEQRQYVLSHMVPIVERLIDEAERAKTTKPQRALMKLEMAQGILPEDHPLQARIAKLHEEISTVPAGEDEPRTGESDELADYLVARGRKALEKDRFAQAIFAFREALRYDANHASARRELALLEKAAKRLYEEAYVLKGPRPDKAAQRLHRAIAMTVENSHYQLKAKRLLRDLELQHGPLPPEPAAARTAAAPGVASPSLPEAPSSAREQAMALHKQGRFDEALAKYEQARAENDDDSEILRLMGSVYAMKGEREKAYALYNKYVDRCPECTMAPAVKRILEDYEQWNR